MTAILGTLPFLATLWLLVILGARVLEESGAKIAAALKGDPQQQISPISARRGQRTRALHGVKSPSVPLRAAA